MAKTEAKSLGTKIDGLTILENISVEDLDTSITAAQEVVEQAQAKLRSLMSLRKVLEWRDGKHRPKRGGGRKKAGKSVQEEAADSQGPQTTEQSAGKFPPAKGGLALLESALRNVPLTMIEMATATGLDLPTVKRLIAENPSRFRQEPTGRWTLRK